MKKVLYKIMFLASVLVMGGCEEVDNAIYDVQEGVTRGAAIRTLEIISANYNFFDPDSTFDIIVEEQDEEFGGLLASINVYASYDDASDSSNDVAEMMISTIDKMDMTTSANGLPSTEVKFSLSEVTALLSATTTRGSSFTFRLEAVLSDGRTFSAGDASGSMQGSFFSSPYSYKAQILCFPDTAYSGDYKIDMFDSYGDGWNGGKIVADMDGTTVDITIASGSSGTYTLSVPAGTQSLVFSWVSGAWDSEVTFDIYGPNSGQIIASGGPSPAAGEIALNLCME
ncbi:MAG: hypothetical protein ACPGR7_08985 [Flavobacteriaceae bacterium]